MGLFYNKGITVKADVQSFGDVRSFVSDELMRLKVEQNDITRSILILEELFTIACGNADKKYSDISVSVRKHMDEYDLVLEYYGARFEYEYDTDNPFNVSGRILSRYGEKLGVRYGRRYNKVTLLVQRRVAKNLKASFIMAVMGSVLGIILTKLLSPEQLQFATNKVAFNLENAFTNAMIMISAPATFFSMVTNITDISIYSDRSFKVKRFISAVIFSSLLALVAGACFVSHLSKYIKYDTEYLVSYPKVDIMGLGLETVPTDIFKAFTLLSPYPLIFIAIITSIAIINMNSRYDAIKDISDTINEFIQSCMNIIYYILPFAVFVVFTDLVMYSGLPVLKDVISTVLVSYTFIIMMVLVYSVKLLINRINPIRFYKTIMPAIIENFKINSLINAEPYNIRFCNRVFGINLKRLDMEIPVVSQINLDGNCCMIMGLTLGIAYASGLTLSVSNLIALSGLILALSVGAPNRSGSLLIGLVVCLSCLGLLQASSWFVIYIEAFAGGMVTIINTIGNMVMVVTSAKKSGELNWKQTPAS